MASLHRQSVHVALLVGVHWNKMNCDGVRTAGHREGEKVCEGLCTQSKQEPEGTTTPKKNDCKYEEKKSQSNQVLVLNVQNSVSVLTALIGRYRYE